jgi:dienelactone hydrolase
MIRAQSFTEDSVPVRVPLRLFADVPEGPGPFPVLLGLHGYAMRAKPFLGLMRQFAPEGFLLVSMQGPHSAFVPGAELSAAGERGYHWGVSDTPADNQAGHRACLEAAIAWAVERGGDPDRVSLAGFSQPCAHNYRASLDPPHGRTFRALVALCGGLPGEWVERNDLPAGTAASRETSALHVSTLDDPFYTPDRIAGFAAMLGTRYRLARHAKYEGTHRAPSAAFPEIRSFLGAEG